MEAPVIPLAAWDSSRRSTSTCQGTWCSGIAFPSSSKRMPSPRGGADTHLDLASLMKAMPACRDDSPPWMTPWGFGKSPKGRCSSPDGTCTANVSSCGYRDIAVCRPFAALDDSGHVEIRLC
jgi:hypothetical protein